MSTDMQISADSIRGFFIGHQLSFSDTVVKLVNSELGMINFSRAATLTELMFMSDESAAKVHAIVVDEPMLGELTALLPRLRERFSNASIVLAYHEPDVARGLIAGHNGQDVCKAIGFLPMKVQIDCWLSALRLLVRGERFMPNDLLVTAQPDKKDVPPLASATAEEPAPQPAPAVRHTDQTGAAKLKTKDDICLTDRELQVLRSAAQGKQNKIIAEELELSQHTIKLHMHHVISKLGVHNRTEAAIWFLNQLSQPQGS